MNGRTATVRVALATGLCLALSLASTQGQQLDNGNGQYAPGEILVKFRPTAPAAQRNFMLGVRAVSVIRRLAALDIDHLRLPAGQRVDDAVAAFRADPAVLLVQPNYVRHTTQQAPPTDPYWLDGTLWGIQKIQAQPAWTHFATGNGSVVVADIDTGVNYNHPDLAANIWQNPGEIPGNGIDDDGDGYADDVHGIDTFNHDSDPMDDNGHGTHTSGTIAGVGNNGIGITGVNWKAKVVSCKFLNAGGNGTDSGAIECFNYLVTLKQRGVNVRVSSNSWGGARGSGPPAAALQSAIDAAGNAGIINIFAAGNSGSNDDSAPFDPASFTSSSIVSVAASDQSDNRAGFSNYGPASVDLAAPGVDILSSYGSIYAYSSGTSMAAPHVAGAAGLLALLNPSLPVALIKSALLTNVDHLAPWSGLVASGGRLNAFLAAGAVSSNTPPAVAVTSPSEGGTVTVSPTLTVSANATDTDGTISSVIFYVNGAAIGTDTSSPFSVSWPSVGPGTYTLTAQALDDLGATTISAAVHVTVVSAPGGPTAVFLGADASTQGNWIGTYGAEGYGIVGDVTSYPAYAQVTNTAPTWQWSGSTTEARALRRASGVGRLAATWYGEMSFDVNLTDGQTHQVGLYAVDWDSTTRSERVDVLDAANNAVLDSQTLSAFTAGRYLVWNLRGHVRLRVTQVGAVNAVVSALFFGGVPPAGGQPTGGSTTAAFLGADASTQGNWIGTYGAEGYGIVGDVTSYPAYAQVAAGAPTWQWTGSTTEARALRRASGVGRLAATWYGDMSFDINLTDGQTHQVALYAVDWDSTTRSQRVDVFDATTDVLLDTQTMTAFTGGRYLVWNLRGHVRLRVTQVGAVNAVVSALFFGGVPPAGGQPTGGSTTAAFLRADASTQGNWIGAYGAEGYGIVGDLTSYPAYAQVAAGAPTWQWTGSTTEARALRRASGVGRLAATWYGDMSFDINLTDGQTHQIALYAVDWDSTTRSQRVDVFDATTDALLDTQTMSGFTGGRYLVWDLRGHVRLRVTQLGAVNAVVSGIFFGGM